MTGVDGKEREVCGQTGKVCYSQREAAYTVRRCKRSRSDRVPRRIYFCRACGWYHLTSLLKK